MTRMIVTVMCTTEAIVKLKPQKQFEKKFNQPWVDTSPKWTMFHFFVH